MPHFTRRQFRASTVAVGAASAASALLMPVQDTDPNARGLLPTLMREAGFAEIAETHVVPTPTGSISIYRAAAMNEKGSCPQTNERTVR